MSNPTARGTLTGELMVAAVILLFAAFVLVFFLYLRAKRYSGACPPLRAARAPLVFVPDPPGAPPRRGLDPALIHALPSTVFDAKNFGACVECAVCLSQLCDGEAARVLPECAHAFHSECIDMWLLSNCTCPLCRLLVLEPCTANNGTDNASSEKLERVLVIDIPRSAEQYTTVTI